ncbi:uncharacterized protein CDV56_103751 [Aspergillus thermomutatus]|uniref:3'-5' exonuclease domain-containing protein n=1 Tax=Aspergillus thermomutatus TaxID=41047 RepID=A0A397GFZ5_ASPTH|nr:uncharacterized protein CDV56_103751 [Aspergillus thermomutatus]RHZ49387.1 hypothetical protein CDV56_103751 [Aspergillus thermomutatus]
MASETAIPHVQMIDSIGDLEKLLNELDYQSHRPSSLFFDVQGTNLGQDGSISIISLFVRPIKTVFLIDVLTLGEDTFTTTSLADNSLKLLLESGAMAKVFFDIGNISHALFNRHGIRLNGIKDLQVMELATRYPHSQEQAASWETCVEKDAHPPARVLALWKQVHSSVNRLRDPAKGGSDAVFNERPLRREIFEYSLQNVLILPRLWEVYCETLCRPKNGFWRSMVAQTVRDRIRESTIPASARRADTGDWGWSREFIETSIAGWNQDVYLQLEGVPMVDPRWLDPNYF